MQAMQFGDAERSALLANVDRLCREMIEPRAERIDASGEFDREIYRAMAEIGLFGLWVPEQYGGFPCDLWTYLLVVERIARSSATCSLNYANGNEPTKILVGWGTDALKQRYLPGIASGDVIPCLAITEPNAGSDVSGITTRAIREGDTYRINGRKHFITNGSVGDIVLVCAKTDPSAGSRGISILAVPADSDGFSVVRDEDLIGLRGSPTSELSFDDVVVGAENLIGAEGQGFKITMAVLDEARLSAACSSLALAGKALELATDYAKSRAQFGSPIIQFQGLQFLLADMATSVATGWALLERATKLLHAGPSKSASVYAAMAKLYCSDIGMSVTTDAVQVHGGIGLTRQVSVERMMRDAKAYQIFDGTNQIQKVIIAKYLSREGPASLRS